MATPFKASVRTTAEDAIIDLHGDLDGSADAALTNAYAEATAGAGTRVLLNFSDADYINSTGIALIVGVLAAARRDGREVGAYGLVEHYRDIFEITRLSDFMTIFDDEQRAVVGSPA